MPDTFIWYELMSNDPALARTFYGAVVGWTMQDQATTVAGMPPYTIASVGSRGVAGISPLSAQARAAGAHAGWTGYIGVADTDATAKRITDAGGRILRQPDDIPTIGRFAVAADPGGAVFMLLVPLPRADMPAPPAFGEPGTVGWHELVAGNGEQAAFDFYAPLFGWESLDAVDMGPMGQYRIIGTGGERFGGMMDMPAQDPRPAWNFYFVVDGIDAAVARIEANGGKVLMGPHEVPGGSWIVQAGDPEGNPFALTAAKR